MSLSTALATYIAALERCHANTHRAEDRPIYEKYLVDAGGILAACTLDEPMGALNNRIKSHERLWGHTWLHDPIFNVASNAWAAVKNEANRLAT